jgi:hypothetical protein
MNEVYIPQKIRDTERSKKWDRNVGFYEYIESAINETNKLQDEPRLYYVYKKIQQSTAREIDSLLYA